MRALYIPDTLFLRNLASYPHKYEGKFKITILPLWNVHFLFSPTQKSFEKLSTTSDF